MYYIFIKSHPLNHRLSALNLPKVTMGWFKSSFFTSPPWNIHKGALPNSFVQNTVLKTGKKAGLQAPIETEATLA